MSSLWTPDGERPVGRPDGDRGSAPDGATDADATDAPDPGDALRAAAEALGLDLDAMSPDERSELQAQLAEMMRVRREAAAVPAAEVLSSYLMQLFDRATIYLEAEPPAFGEAATMIEAFRSVLDGVGDRLGENEPVLREALGQAQMIFVQVKHLTEGTAPDS